MQQANVYGEEEGDVPPSGSKDQYYDEEEEQDDTVTKDHDDDYDEDDEEGIEQEFENPLDIVHLNEIPEDLRYWNIAATIVQFLQAGALFYLANEANTKWFLFTHFPGSLDDRDDANFGIPESEQVGDGYSVTWYSGAFLALSGCNHLASLVFESTYNYYIERNQNPFRWFEYALSASVMRIMIAQLAGVTDIHLLFTIFCLTATTMLLGSIHESVNAKARADGDRYQNWFPFILAWLPQLASWAVIFNYFFYSVVEGDPPIFVWTIVIVLFLLDATFAVLFWLQWNQDRPAFFDDYVVGEKGFIVLSFTAKAALAWINYGGGSR